MNIRVFQSDEGDCLLITGGDGRRMLCDGGMAASFREHVADHLSSLSPKPLIDVVYVSHIDSDHISGVLRMMDDLVAWRVHDYQVGGPDSKHEEPDFPRPPKIGAIWHNAFHEQIGQNGGEIEDMLAASAAILSGSELPDFRVTAEANRNLVASTREAIKLTRRVGEDQLGIPVNGPADGHLMMVRSSTKPVQLGGMRLYIIGPFSEDLLNLRQEWNDWLRKNKEVLARIREEAREIERGIGTAEVAQFIGPLLTQARVFGDRGAVTTPNLASLMFYVEEKSSGARVLLTGDGHAKEVLKGLEHIGKLGGGGALHVDVLKVQHHGSEYNMSRDFAKRVTADHYIFCANGSHGNPDIETLQVLLDSRLGEAGARSENPNADKAFEFWFNSHESVAGGKAGNPAYMREIEALVSERAKKSQGRMKAHFLRKSSFELHLS